jgi:predicted metal-dependent phosphoesterase TrpH
MIEIDLHSHTYFSDGLYSPEWVVDSAYAAGTRMLALTDHNTLDGIPGFLAAAKKYPDLIPVIGAELSKNDFAEILALDIKNPAAISEYAAIKGAADIGRALRTAESSGGISVLAHPIRLGLRGAELDTLIGKLKDMGLMGIECFHPEHPADMADECLGLATRYDLLVTAGSDSHGEPGSPCTFGYFGGGNRDTARAREALSRTRDFIIARRNK